MTMQNSGRNSVGFYLLLAPIILLATYLRLYSLPDQILLDDEWHGISFVIGKSYWEILTYYNPNDYSSPILNLWRLFLYDFWNWTELGLRLPALLAGLLTVIFIPVLIRRSFNTRVAILFALFAAISPQMIFYSRYCRGYSLSLFFGFCVLFIFNKFVQKARLTDAFLIIIGSSLAVYSHPFSLIAILAMFIAVFGTKLLERLKRKIEGKTIRTDLRYILVLGIALICIMTLLLLPMLKNISDLPWAKSELTVRAVISAATLITGTANIPLVVIFWALTLLGVFYLLKKDRFFGMMFLAMMVLYFLALIVSSPMGVSEGAIIVRYMIVLLPAFLMLTAFGLDITVQRIQKIVSWQKSIAGKMTSILMIFGFVALFYFCGPLPVLYSETNNFMNHSAFQWSYSWNHFNESATNHIYSHHDIKREEIPEFYNWLGKQNNIDAIIEYPFDICDYNNLFYYYQHFHKKRVYAGYCPEGGLIGYQVMNNNLESDESVAIGMLTVDQILSLVPDLRKVKFCNMCNVCEIEAILNTRADVIVFHKYIRALHIMKNARGSIDVHYRSVPLLRNYYQEYFGAPLFEDNEIVCFSVKRG